MIWDCKAPSYWVNTDFSGYEIHIRSLPKKGAKTVFDKIPEAWIVDTKTGKRIKHFKNQPSILAAADKAVTHLRASGLLSDLEIKLEKERLAREKREAERDAERNSEEEFKKYKKYTDFAQ